MKNEINYFKEIVDKVLKSKSNTEFIAQEFKKRGENLQRKTTEERKVIEELKGQKIESPKGIEKIGDYLAFKEKINPRMIEQIRKELDEIKKHPGTKDLALMDNGVKRKEMLTKFLKFLEATYTENATFIDRLKHESDRYIDKQVHCVF
jgi:hypothetical protein